MENTFKNSTNNPIVDAVGQMNITGNIIPEAWYKTIVNEKGKVNLLAVHILSDIVYWYRPTEVRDENTLSVTYEKKFKDNDFLQRSYDQLSEKFNISKKQARDCIVFLESLGLIKRHFRTIQSPIGPLANVMFIELVPECLKAITYPDSYKDTSKNDDSSIQDDIGVSTNSYTPAYDNKVTYTDSTPDITTNTSSQNTTLSNDQNMPSVVDEAKDLFRNLNLPDKDIISIVRASGNNLDKCRTALEVFSQQTTRINNIAGWLIKAVENNYQLQHKRPEAKKNSFNNFEQRQYNFDEIEQKLLCRHL